MIANKRLIGIEKGLQNITIKELLREQQTTAHSLIWVDSWPIWFSQYFTILPFYLFPLVKWSGIDTLDLSDTGFSAVICRLSAGFAKATFLIELCDLSYGQYALSFLPKQAWLILGGPAALVHGLVAAYFSNSYLYMEVCP